MFGNVLSRLQRRSESNRLVRRTPRVAPMMEGLEDRRLLSTGYALFGNSGAVLAKFDTSKAHSIVATRTVHNLPQGMQLKGIDFRPTTGELHALGVRSTSGDDEGQVFTLNLSTGDATAVGPVFSLALNPGESYGFDFNPTSDRIRVTNGADQNFRINPFVGTVMGPDPDLANASDDEEITGAAYDRNVSTPVTIFANGPTGLTTLFGIDFINDTLVRIGGVDGGAPEGSPNDGIVTEIGSLGITIGSASNGFDIGQDGTAFALLNDSDTGLTGLYTIDLSTGTATFLDTVNNGAEIVRGFAIAPDNKPPRAVNDSYTVNANGSITRTAGQGLLKNDSDPEGNSLSAINTNDPTNGILNLNPDGSFTYTPNSGFVGVDGFSYVASDGTSVSTLATVSFNVVPAVSVSDSWIFEGNSGESDMTFQISLNAPAGSSDVVVNYKTQNVSAGEGDYVVVPAGTVTFTSGESAKNVVVKIKGDTKIEADETFNLKITSVSSNAVIADGNGVGMVVNDELTPVTPKIFIADAQIVEGQSGTQNLLFNVTLDVASTKTIKVNFATQNFTAGEGDYGVKSGTLTFNPGDTLKQISIVIKGDTKGEFNEQFRVNLSSLVNVDAGDLQALGTIISDDAF